MMMTPKKLKIFVFAVIINMVTMHSLFGQSVYQPYSYDFYQKFSAQLYSTNTDLQTSLKPFFIDDSLIKHTYDSLMNIGVKNGNPSEFQKLLTQHQLDVKHTNYTLYGDFLPDAEVGEDFSSHTTVWTTSLGYQMGGTIGSKFSFYGSVYANRAEFPPYITNYINSTYYIPGEGNDLNRGRDIKDWIYTSFLFSYTPVKFVNFSLGKDKNFIGDGYRSLLLSDFASNYPFFRTTVTLGNVRYMAMYALMNDPNAPMVPNSDATRKKWAYFQYIDWNISKRVSIGFFQNVMAVTEDNTGQKRGFNFGLASPFVFWVPIDDGEDDPDKNLIGFTAKYKVFNKTIIYGQFALNEFHAQDFFSNDGAVDNKYAEQIGIRGADLFSIKGLNYLAEYDAARPYTYSSFDPTSNYSQDDQPLADPFGGNFREWLGILNYSLGRFDFRGQLEYAYFGLDLNGQDYGQDIFEPYTSAVQPYGNTIGQGLRTNFYYAEGKMSYLINPKYNLRFELGGLYREEKNIESDSKTPMIVIGIKSSFRNIYTDF